jgi:hypothetical protein
VRRKDGPRTIWKDVIIRLLRPLDFIRRKGQRSPGEKADPALWKLRVDLWLGFASYIVGECVEVGWGVVLVVERMVCTLTGCLEGTVQPSQTGMSTARQEAKMDEHD